MILDSVVRFLENRLSSAPGIREITVNPGFTGVLLESGDMGLAMNVRKGTGFDQIRFYNDMAFLIGMEGLEGSRRLEHACDPLTLSVRVALINALSRPFMTPENLQKAGHDVAVGPDRYSIAELMTDKVVVIVGFGGNVTRIAEKARKVYVTELDPERFSSVVINSLGAFKGPFSSDIIHAGAADPYFKTADAVVLTGCTLVTQTMESILEKCCNKQVIVYGWTAGFFPEPLFEMGVDAISMSVVQDSEKMMEILKNCGPMAERFFPQAGQELFIKRKKDA